MGRGPTDPVAASRSNYVSRGFTLLEAVVVLAVIGALAATAGTKFIGLQENERLKSAARDVANAFSLANAEAIRTGENQVVYFRAGDPPGATVSDQALVDVQGNAVPVLILSDGEPGSTDQNCEIDAGEGERTFAARNDVGFGMTNANTGAPGDGAAGDISTGSSFQDAGGNDITWVVFRPDGIPVAFDDTCAMDGVGSGNGAIYLTNGQRDYAVVLQALGTSKVWAWEQGGGAWQ